MKYIFVDFDDTLCLHRSSIKSDLCINIVKEPYLSSEPNYKLIEYLKIKNNDGYKIILVTNASSFMLEHKKKWINKICPQLFYAYESFSIDCSKQEYIERMLDEHDIEDAIYIDDSASERAKAEYINNLIVYSPQIIANEEK